MRSKKMLLMRHRSANATLPLLLLLLLLAQLLVICEAKPYVHATKCEEIFIDGCKNLGYKMTTSGGEAYDIEKNRLQIMLNHVLQLNCSSKLRQLTCSMLVPMCHENWQKPIGPCGSLCLQVQADCRQKLQQFKMEWPKWLDCYKYPMHNSHGDGMCLDFTTSYSVSTTTTTTASTNGNSAGWPKRQPTDWWQELNEWRRTFTTGHIPADCSHLRNKKLYAYNNHTASCQLRCHANDLFNQDDKQVAEIWMAILSCLCCLSSLATILTFLISDAERFKYPIRPVIIMAVCYLFYSISFIIRLIAGRQATACDTVPMGSELALTTHGLDNAVCAIVFLLQYFFGTAASAWYAILVVTWLLQTGWKWSRESVAKRSCYLHMPAWTIAIGLTVSVLIVRRVDADELFGMCGVGHRDTSSLLVFVIIPNAAFLILATVCLIAGGISMLRVRQHIRSDGQTTRNFDLLMTKIGLFSAMYMIPNLFVVIVNTYEYMMWDLWHLPGSPYRPSLTLHLIRMFASLAIGITTVMWIWNCKTIDSWRNCLLPAARKQAANSKDNGYVMAQKAQVPRLYTPAAAIPDAAVASCGGSSIGTSDYYKPRDSQHRSYRPVLQQQQHHQQQLV